jgi:hypothetical protein
MFWPGGILLHVSVSLGLVEEGGGVIMMLSYHSATASKSPTVVTSPLRM